MMKGLLRRLLLPIAALPCSSSAPASSWRSIGSSAQAAAFAALAGQRKSVDSGGGGGGGRWKLGKTALILTIGSIGGAGTLGWVALGDDRERRMKLVWAVPLRLTRDVATAAAIVADYNISLWGLKEESPERALAKHEAHVRCANRLQALCFKNGGIYIKLGQHVGQLDYLLPQEYVETMRNSLLDKCPVSTYEQVCAVFSAELGLLPHEVFKDFNPVPLASASLAQVHLAHTHDGKKVAVKVQHIHLTDTAAADTATVALIVNVVHWLFPSFDYRWLLDEVQESLPKELDFIHEAKNSELCVYNFKKQSPHLAPYIAIPEVYWTLSTSRLLTMEYMEGIKITDVQQIKKLGLRPSDVAKLMSQAFAEMIFRHGFVHCDPHAANMLVRVAPGNHGFFGNVYRMEKATSTCLA
ncbi:hypothetical protein O6H91_10G103500 [Diphasiastrum complanatum]|uniref:Uncharacterized protein n=1 Tax=Diphasiastrum complanatum TaxID=34168 RepID=A0ACC2CK50_DIPCM|nr:hypothetical protein O6H91_10G103500 [Diphasiastrum complanatum]